MSPRTTPDPSTVDRPRRRRRHLAVVVLLAGLVAAVPGVATLAGFTARDVNRDNKITPDELTLLVVRPQNDPYGTNRTVSVKVDFQGNVTQ